MALVKRIEACGTRSGKPSKKVVISDCGQVRVQGAGRVRLFLVHAADLGTRLLSKGDVAPSLDGYDYFFFFAPVLLWCFAK